METKLVRGLCSFFTPDTTRDLAKKELREAERSLLAAQTQYEYCKHMVAYNTERVTRLSACLKRLEAIDRIVAGESDA